jgi:hypothetical protein
MSVNASAQSSFSFNIGYLEQLPEEEIGHLTPCFVCLKQNLIYFCPSEIMGELLAKQSHSYFLNSFEKARFELEQFEESIRGVS